VRLTQSRLDAKLTAYSQYVSDLARKNAAPSDAVSVDMSGSTPSAQDRAAMEAEIQALLVRRLLESLPKVRQKCTGHSHARIVVGWIFALRLWHTQTVQLLQHRIRFH